MKSFESVFMLDRLFRRSRYPVSLAQIREVLECGERSAYRTIEYMRKYFEAPIEYGHHPAGYRYTDEAWQLPGLWFSTKELQALVIVLRLLQLLQPGLLEEVLAPLRQRLETIAKVQGLSVEAGQRLRLPRYGARPPADCFDTVAAAALQRRRLSMSYLSRSSGQKSRREVSPQHLLYYRDKWYLDAWCHRNERLQTFELNQVTGARMLDTAAIDIPEAELDAELTPAYGIFSGAATATAILAFHPDRARWIDGEIWHPAQKTYRTDNNELIYEIPYGRADELILDILRYGPDVEVLGPPELREAVAERLRAAAARYPGRDTH